MTGMLEGGAKLNVVEDLAIQHNPDAFVFIVDGLLAALKIDDTQPRMPQTDEGINVEAGTVRPAMRQRPDHSLQPRRWWRARRASNTGDTAHDRLRLH